MRSTVHDTILVRLTDDEGRPFPDTQFEMFENFVARLVGGFIRQPDADGARWSPTSGKLVPVRSRSYWITLEAATADEQIARIDSFIQRCFRL
jgi:hypothetical protein